MEIYETIQEGFGIFLGLFMIFCIIYWGYIYLERSFGFYIMTFLIVSLIIVIMSFIIGYIHNKINGD